VNPNSAATSRCLYASSSPFDLLISRRSFLVLPLFSSSAKGSFSTIYPLAPVKTSNDGSQSISWNGHVEKDGAMTMKDGLKVSYLFWE
jgi:hypothetical protein